jgi:penicillin-binding protein 1A
MAQTGRRPASGGRNPGGRTPGGRTPGGRKRAERPRAGFVERLARGLLRLVWWVTSRAALAAALALALATAYYYAQMPSYDVLLDGRERGSVTLIDARDEVFAWRGDQKAVTRADAVSPHLVNAVVATEDRRFFRHFGVDLRGTLRALVVNIREGRTVQGGSSITQQVAKLVWFDNVRTIERKIREIPAALALELRFSKEEILTIYLNRAYLGAGATGFEAAAQRYFGKSAAEVNAAEAAMLAGLLRAPSRYAPTRDLARAQNRANTIITVMEREGYLTAAQAADARANPARLSAAAEARAGGDFADWVMTAGPEFLTRSTREDVEILTTFDGRIQRAAEQALRHVFETRVREGSEAQAAIVVMSPDGAVRAMVGGRRTTPSDGQFNRATQALRQTGSLFKTFVYAAALEAGYSPYDRVVDAPLTINIPGSGPWSPQNYTRDFLGEITLAEAFARSTNTAAVRVSEHVGRERVRALARDLGIVSPIASGPAMALGASEATLLEITGAYAGILNGGVRARPYGIREVRLRGDRSRVLGGDREAPVRVIDERAAGQLVWMMNQVVEAGTGTRARMDGRPAAGKTGTTSAMRDAWFVGFTADYVAGVWMGYDDNTPLTGVTGGGLPAEIWRETMARIHEGLPPRPLPMIAPQVAPPPVAEVQPQPQPQVPAQPGGGYQPYGQPRQQPPVASVDEAVRSVVESVMRGLGLY